MANICSPRSGGGGGGGSSGPPPGCVIPASVQCQDYKLSGQRWSGNPVVVGYYFDNSVVPSYLNNAQGLAGIFKAIDDAFAEWEKYTPGIDFVRKGVCNGCAHNINDGKNGIGFTEFPPNDALGKTYRRPSIGNLQDVDTLLDLDPSTASLQFDWTIGLPNPCVQLYDVQNVLTHEFGHWLRLLDLYKNYDKKLTMYGDLSTDICLTLRRDLAAGDKLGIKAIYGNKTIDEFLLIDL